MLNYTKTNENRLGWHIEFTEPILEANFKEACKIAIELAKVECHLDGAIAINFVAQGVPVQVVETSNVETQFALWKRLVEGTAFTNLMSQMPTPGIDDMHRPSMKG